SSTQCSTPSTLIASICVPVLNHTTLPPLASVLRAPPRLCCLRRPHFSAAASYRCGTSRLNRVDHCQVFSGRIEIKHRLERQELYALLGVRSPARSPYAYREKWKFSEI